MADVWREAFEERAAIMEFDGGLSRLAAKSAIKTAPAPEPTPALASEPAAHLYQLVSDHREAAARPVLTPHGLGRPWQTFADRAGVVLDAAPGRVAFFNPS